MHRTILGAALVAMGVTSAAASATGAAAEARANAASSAAAETGTNAANGAASSAAAAPACPGRGAAVLERFTSADCPDCWAAPGQAAPAVGAWLFDWITPTPQGDQAPLSAAAADEARDRALRAGGPSPVAGQMLAARSTLPSTARLQLAVRTGPAWNGYFGLQFLLSGPVPPGATGWLALVEHLPAGSEGSPVERQLVRTVAGPLPLDAARRGHTLDHLRAMRWPDSARPERLKARAWIEAADGQLLAIAAERCPSR